MSFAAIDPREIKAAEIETSDTIDVFHFVKAKEVDPIYFERSYYVVPDSDAENGYALLFEAMRKEKCVGIARIGMHRREHMLILRPSEHHLVAIYDVLRERNTSRSALAVKHGIQQ